MSERMVRQARVVVDAQVNNLVSWLDEGEVR